MALKSPPLKIGSGSSDHQLVVIDNYSFKEDMRCIRLSVVRQSTRQQSRSYEVYPLRFEVEAGWPS